jgi:hypothetical protein
MRNFMIFIGFIVVAIFAYQALAPTLIEHGVDMNRTAIDDTNVEELNETKPN